jgi:hypothetical protein
VSTQGAAEHRLVHVHEFVGNGVRLAPPTGRLRLSWQQALRVGRRQSPWESRRPQVKLADFSNSYRGPEEPVLAWIVVFPDALTVFMGPDIAPAAARVRRRCPGYVVVDATSGHALEAFQTCPPSYRG